MRVRVLPLTPGDPGVAQHLMSYLVDERIAIDAGCLGLHLADPAVAALRHVLLTHAHIDHIATLPMFLENGPARGGGPLELFGPAASLEALERHVFNRDVWIRRTAMRRGNDPWVTMMPLAPEETVAVNGLRVTPVPVDHSAPTFGYLIEDGTTAIAFGGDSGPTERLWRVAGATERLRAVFLECSFPDELEDLALRTGHLTPRLWALETSKLPPGIAVYAVHLKPAYRAQVVSELARLGDPRLHVAEAGRVYDL